jgi:hypothetical protein
MYPGLRILRLTSQRLRSEAWLSEALLGCCTCVLRSQVQLFPCFSTSVVRVSSFRFKNELQEGRAVQTEASWHLMIDAHPASSP